MSGAAFIDMEVAKEMTRTRLRVERAILFHQLDEAYKAYGSHAGPGVDEKLRRINEARKILRDLPATVDSATTPDELLALKATIPKGVL